MKKRLLDTLLFSEKRKNLMILLRDGSRNLAEIRQILNVTSAGMIPQIRILEQRDLIYQDDRGYSLTDTGRLLSNQVYKLVQTVDVIEKNETFWNQHAIDAIPIQFLERIRELGDYQILDIPLENIAEPPEPFVENLLQSGMIMGAAPNFDPAYPSLFIHLAQQNINISLILTRNVFDKAISEYRDEIHTFLQFDNTHMFVSESDIKTAFVTTDIMFYMTLFFKNGTMDLQKDLISFDQSAIKWGEGLFNYYKEQSEEIESP